MSSTERARESRRYEDALRDGTYNNPILQNSGPAVRAGVLYLRQRQAEREAIEAERQNALADRQRAEQRQAEAQREAEIAARNRELVYAERGMRFWGRRDLRSDPTLASALAAYRAGSLDTIATYDLYGAALTLRVEKTDGSSRLTDAEAAAGAARLALEACKRGQFLPAFLLADPELASDDFKRALAHHGNMDLQRTPYYYVGWAWPSPGEYDAAREHGLVSQTQQQERERARALSKSFGEEPYDPSDQGRLFRVLVLSRLVPWVYGDLIVKQPAQQALVELRRNRPATGVFVSALYEDILRYERDRPSPWADLLYAHAAKLAGDGFISAFVEQRTLENRRRDRAEFQQWQAWRAQGMVPADFAALEPSILVRAAGRLLLNHDVPQLDPGFTGLAPQAADQRRHRLAHALLFDLTLQGDPNALTLQYLATSQEEDADEPSLAAYERAVLRHLGLVAPGSVDPFNAAGWMESAPVSSPTAYYADRPRWATLGFPGTRADADPLVQRKFHNATTYGTYDSEWDRLISVKLPGIISAATLLNRYQGADLAQRCEEYFSRSPKKGFAAVLTEVQRARLARLKGDETALAQSLRRLGELTLTQSSPRWTTALTDAIRQSDASRIEELLQAPGLTDRVQLAWLQQLPRLSGEDQARSAPWVAHILREHREQQPAASLVSAAEWAEAARELAREWKKFPATAQTDFAGDAFVLTALAEVLAPDRAQTDALLAGYPRRFYRVQNNRALDYATDELLKRATRDRDEPLVSLLAPLYPVNSTYPLSLYLGRFESALDEIQGFPRRKAHEAEVARGEALLARAGDLLDEPRHAALAARVFYRAWMIDIHQQAFFPQLRHAANQLSPGGPGGQTRASHDPKHLAIQAHLLTAALDIGMDDEEDRKAVLADSELARELWERRAEWSPGREENLLTLLATYSQLEQRWAQKAWSQVWGSPPAAIRLAALRTTLPEQPAPRPTPVDLTSPEFVAAARQPRAGIVPDDPWTDLEQLLARQSPNRR